MISTIALIAGLIIGIALGRQILFRKSIGEALVANTIAAHFKQPHTLLNNVTLPTDTGTTQIDHVLVADAGIFVIETKHYSGWIFGGPKQSQWTQVIYKVKNKFQNPIRQNYGHLKTIQSLFTLPDDNFVPLVVFTGNAEFKSDLGPNVIQLNQLIDQLTGGRPVLFDERKMAYIIGRIEMKRLRRSLETDEYHLNTIRSKIRQRLP
jgi:hypothetical protein